MGSKEGTDRCGPLRSASLCRCAQSPGSPPVPVHVDHKRYIHLDIAGGTNDFGSGGAGGSAPASGAASGAGGSLRARQRHTAYLHAHSSSLAIVKDATHGLCQMCVGATAFVSNYIRYAGTERQALH